MAQLNSLPAGLSIRTLRAGSPSESRQGKVAAVEGVEKRWQFAFPPQQLRCCMELVLVVCVL